MKPDKVTHWLGRVISVGEHSWGLRPSAAAALLLTPTAASLDGVLSTNVSGDSTTDLEGEIASNIPQQAHLPFYLATVELEHKRLVT